MSCRQQIYQYGVGTGSSNTGQQGEQKWTELTALRGADAQCDDAQGFFFLSILTVACRWKSLVSSCSEVSCAQLPNQLLWDGGSERTAEINEHSFWHPSIHYLFSLYFSLYLIESEERQEMQGKSRGKTGSGQPGVELGTSCSDHMVCVLTIRPSGHLSNYF